MGEHAIGCGAALLRKCRIGLHRFHRGFQVSYVLVDNLQVLRRHHRMQARGELVAVYLPAH